MRIVDFNGDGTVGIEDLVVFVEHWGQPDPRCDFGPMPWGDGKVDAADLEVLMSYWGQEVDDPTLLAHWPLDETDGIVAHDHTRANDITIMGAAVWQPTGGVVDGALELDGMTFGVAAAVLNPADGPFSVVAWVKGGAPGQVTISQPAGANWLLMDAGGRLMTELKGRGRSDGPLLSETVITDGQWHRIGLVWDGSRRMLYVDGVVAAEDTQSAMPSSGNGLYIGTGSRMEPGTFWSGLIDDIRIYNRVVSP
jgi:hypothetical protein